MKKVTKEQLLKENAVLKSRIEEWEKSDIPRREKLSELLGSIEYYNSFGGDNKKIKVQSWLGIAFLIGELKADANYAMCIEAREILRNENNGLKQEIYRLKNPENKT